MKRLVVMLAVMSFFVIIPLSHASTPTFQTSPITSWYVNATYTYNAQVTQAGNWTLKSDLSAMKLTQNMNDSAYGTSDVSVWGIPTASGSYYVNLSFNGSGTVYQNYTLIVSNQPYITTNPNPLYFQGENYEYNFSSTQNGTWTSSLPSWLNINTTNDTIWGMGPSNGTYNLTLTISNVNGSYTQAWNVTRYYPPVPNTPSHFILSNTDITYLIIGLLLFAAIVAYGVMKR